MKKTDRNWRGVRCGVSHVTLFTARFFKGVSVFMKPLFVLADSDFDFLTRSNALFREEQKRSCLFRAAEDPFALVSGIPSQKI